MDGGKESGATNRQGGSTDGPSPSVSASQPLSTSAALQLLESTEREVIKLMQIAESASLELSKAPHSDMGAVSSLSGGYLECVKNVKSNITECVDTLTTAKTN